MVFFHSYASVYQRVCLLVASPIMSHQLVHVYCILYYICARSLPSYKHLWLFYVEPCCNNCSTIVWRSLNLPIQSPNTAQSANPKPQEESQQNEMVRQWINWHRHIENMSSSTKSWLPWHAGCGFLALRRLSGAPFVASAVFLPQRVQLLSVDGGTMEGFLAKDRFDNWLYQNDRFLSSSKINVGFTML